jgi:hypothetical protein
MPSSIASSTNSFSSAVGGFLSSPSSGMLFFILSGLFLTFIRRDKGPARLCDDGNRSAGATQASIPAVSDSNPKQQSSSDSAVPKPNVADVQAKDSKAQGLAVAVNRAQSNDNNESKLTANSKKSIAANVAFSPSLEEMFDSPVGGPSSAARTLGPRRRSFSQSAVHRDIEEEESPVRHHDESGANPNSTPFRPISLKRRASQASMVGMAVIAVDESQDTTAKAILHAKEKPHVSFDPSAAQTRLNKMWSSNAEFGEERNPFNVYLVRIRNFEQVVGNSVTILLFLGRDCDG